jgi:hypothetical protein
MKLRLVRRSVIAVICLSLGGALTVLGLGTGTATADLGSSPTTSSSGSGDGTDYRVKVTYTSTGTGDSDNPQPVKYSDANFRPPVCWYTSMTPDQFKAEIKRRYLAAGAENAMTVYNFYNDQNNQMDAYHYNKGKDGSWWVLTWDDSQLNNPNNICPYDDGYFWRDPGNPPQGRITPQMLADAAYGQMRLPSKGVTLSPVPGNQKVNLPTYVSFQRADARVTETAQLTEPDGTTVAATVVAEPYSLHVDAGTQYADPGSCDYRVEGASLNSAGSDCNITYTKASAGTYPLTADMTWHVWWTPTATAQPNGTALTDGFSEFPQDVTVQEIQAVNR